MHPQNITTMKSLKTIFTVSLAALTLASCENYFDENRGRFYELMNREVKKNAAD